MLASRYRSRSPTSVSAAPEGAGVVAVLFEREELVFWQVGGEGGAREIGRVPAPHGMVDATAAEGSAGSPAPVALVYGGTTRPSTIALPASSARTAIIAPVVEPHPAGAPRPRWNVAFVGDVIADTTLSYRDFVVTDPGTYDQGLPGERGRVFVLY